MDNISKKSRKESQPVESKETSAEPNRGPVRTVRVNDVSASIWSREVTVKGVLKTFHSVSFERSYKTNDGEYKYSRSFDPETLPRLIEAIHQVEAAMKELQPTA
jgi:hypothetical protein